MFVMGPKGCMEVRSTASVGVALGFSIRNSRVLSNRGVANTWCVSLVLRYDFASFRSLLSATFISRIFVVSETS